jgi:hypothetical protein
MVSVVRLPDVVEIRRDEQLKLLVGVDVDDRARAEGPVEPNAHRTVRVLA